MLRHCLGMTTIRTRLPSILPRSRWPAASSEENDHHSGGPSRSSVIAAAARAGGRVVRRLTRLYGNSNWLSASPLHLTVRRTLRISCEGRTTLPWSAVTGPTMVLRPASNRPSSAASACSTPPCASPRRRCRPFLRLGQIVRPIHSRALANATREGVARRALLSLPSRQGCDAPHTRRAATCCPLGRHGSASGPELNRGRPRDQATRCICSPGRDALP
jgi:hypothetical protein